MIISWSLFVLMLTVGFVPGTKQQDTTRSFTIDHKANTFLKDGQPFRYISGSFHYFRALPAAWRTRLRTMRAGGLNALDTYVEWSFHNPHEDVYKWDGMADVVRFIKMAQEEGFLVILRPGPYICAERDNGGLPHWLFTKYPNIKLRTNDDNYTAEVRKWYGELMPRLKDLFYGNGGPIIMVQVENEYGAFSACDKEYLNWLRDETKKYTQDKALLFTVDIPNDRMKCGKIEGVFATTDFGIDRINEIDDIWKMLRGVQPTGPLVNSEFYPGWLTHWHENNERRNGTTVANALRTILNAGASVNMYMYFGGTNFGFSAGANDWGFANYKADITSYDYDAVMDEAGGVTPKYNLIREVIKQFMEVPEINVTLPKRKAYGSVELQPVLELLSTEGRSILSKGTPIKTNKPQTFEELDQFSGLVLYETTLPNLEMDPTQLRVQGLRDRAFVYINQKFVGTLSRENNIYSLPLHKGWGSRLQLLVENQGRINYNVANDTKGIMGSISVTRANGQQQALFDWTSTSFPLEDAKTTKALDTLLKLKGVTATQSILLNGPIVYLGIFNVCEVGDTYLNVSGWGKGVAYINGFNLGRYWPLAGPQLTLYLPSELLHVGNNTLVLLEYQRANKKANSDDLPTVSLDLEAQLDNNGGEK